MEQDYNNRGEQLEMRERMLQSMARDINYWKEKVKLEKDLSTKRQTSLEEANEANRKLCGE